MYTAAILAYKEAWVSRQMKRKVEQEKERRCEKKEQTDGQAVPETPSTATTDPQNDGGALDHGRRHVTAFGRESC